MFSSALARSAGNESRAALTWSSNVTAAAVLADHERHDRLLGVEAILGLIPDERPRAVEHVLGDLLADVGREAVHRDRLAARNRQQLTVEAEALEIEEPLLALLLLAHARPDVGVEHVGLRRSRRADRW